MPWCFRGGVCDLSTPTEQQQQQQQSEATLRDHIMRGWVHYHTREEWDLPVRLELTAVQRWGNFSLVSFFFFVRAIRFRQQVRDAHQSLLWYVYELLYNYSVCYLLIALRWFWNSCDITEPQLAQEWLSLIHSYCDTLWFIIRNGAATIGWLLVSESAVKYLISYISLLHCWLRQNKWSVEVRRTVTRQFCYFLTFYTQKY